MIIRKEFKYPTDTSKKKRWYATISCDKCGEVSTKIYSLGRNYDTCESCLKGRFTTEEFIARCRSHHGELFDYTKTLYTGKRKMITYTCRVHGEVTQRAQEHMDGHGCLQCARDVRAESYRITLGTWIVRLEAKAPHVTIVSYGQLGYYSPVVFLCERHGEFTSTFGAIDRTDYVCAKCANADSSRHSRHASEDRAAYIYYVYIPSVNAWKIGVTSRSVQERFLTLRAELLWQLEVPTEKLAYQIERVLLDRVTQYRVFPKGTIRSGSSELISVNIYNEIPHDVIQEVTRASIEQSIVETHLNGETLIESIPC